LNIVDGIELLRFIARRFREIEEAGLAVEESIAASLGQKPVNRDRVLAIQAMDLLIQTSQDMAGLCEAAAIRHAEGQFERGDLAAGLKLGALRRELMGESADWVERDVEFFE
jgi:hypothetical protein